MPAAASSPRARVAVLLSGTGSLCAALLAATDDAAYPAEVVVVGSDRPADGLEHARDRGVPTFTCALADHPDRASWDRTLADRLRAFEPDLVVSAGFMKLVGPPLLSRVPMVNTHPALCPAFPGMHGAADALAYGVKVTGATLFVVDDGVDTGPIVAQVTVPVADDDTAESLHDRIKVAEREMLVASIGRMAREGWSVDGRRVRLG